VQLPAAPMGSGLFAFAMFRINDHMQRE